MSILIKNASKIKAKEFTVINHYPFYQRNGGVCMKMRSAGPGVRSPEVLKMRSVKNAEC